MPFLVGPAQPAIYVFLNWESKHKSLFFFLFLPFIGTLKILPTERELLDLYLLNLPYQDPEWVNFLNTTQLSSPPAELDSAFQSFMRLEFSVSAREMLLWRTKDEIQSIPLFKWFSLLLVPVPNSSPGSSQCLALSILRGCNINKFAHDQVPVIVIRLPELRGLSVETFTNNRRFLMVFPLLTAALSTPPDIWCQTVARFLISLIIELSIFVASIVQVREEGWTSGMRESGSIDKKEE
ncbi:unnamed protein product [Prunus armeniaca]|uniref:Uncharacterized protein n=1 Tax=Prunus armeniaca TaxID=36596 RepID=A0A6J5X0U7_PRUAR|nr:unnamed protein product [Prunus armeniaca]